MADYNLSNLKLKKFAGFLVTSSEENGNHLEKKSLCFVHRDMALFIFVIKLQNVKKSVQWAKILLYKMDPHV